jgi:hypothetical protein
VNDFEKRDKEQSELVQSNRGLLIGLLINLCVLGYNFLDIGDKYYDGEKLSKLTLILDKNVDYVDGTFFETDKLRFSALTYDCDFWITNGSFKVANSNKDLLQRLLKINKGDTVVVSVYRDHLQHLNDKNWNIPIIGIDYSNSILISTNQTQRTDDEAIRWDLILGVLFGVVIIIWLKSSIID